MKDNRAARLLSVTLATVLVLAAVIGAVSYGGGVDVIEQVNPVGEAEAIGVTGALIGGVVIGTVACDTVIKEFCDPDAVDKSELQKADALETKTEIHAQGSTVAQSSDNLDTALNNYLQDTRSIARMEGKNAYIKSLNNGTSEAASRTAARSAIEDYYAARQLSVKNNWDTSAITIGRMRSVAINTTGIDMNITHFPVVDNFLTGDTGTFVAVAGYSAQGTVDAVKTAEIETVGNRTLTLVNESDTNVKGIQIHAGNTGEDKTYAEGFGSHLESGDFPSSDHHAKMWATPASGNLSFTQPSATGDVYKIVTQAPSGSFDKQDTLRFWPYADQWQAIETQNQAVQGNVSTFINATYDSYQAGEINSSDLVDPYLAAREYSPEGNFGTWALRSLTSMGMSPPQNMSGIGDMTIDYAGQTYNGILLSDGLPEGDAFEIGTAYDTANLTGSQFIMDPYNEQMVEMNGEFTITNATTADGETLGGSVSYRTVDYETADTQEYQALMTELTNLTEDLNARQERLRSGDGGTGIFPGLPDIGLGAVGGAVGAVVLIVFVLLVVTVASFASVGRPRRRP